MFYMYLGNNINLNFIKIIGWGFRDIQNNQGRCKCYREKPETEADSTYWDFDYSRYHKMESINCFYILTKMHYVEETNQPAMFLLYCVHDATLPVN